MSDPRAEAAARDVKKFMRDAFKNGFAVAEEEVALIISRHYAPAVERLAELERWRMDLAQDQCEGAYVETSWADAALQALSEVAPDHPLLKGEPPSYGVWLSLRRENERLRAENNALRKVLQTGTCHET